MKMKKFLFFSLLLWSVVLVSWFFQPKVEVYGQATLQYDEENEAYFVETNGFRGEVTQFLDGKNSAREDVPVSFVKATYLEGVRVHSGVLSQEEMLKEAVSASHKQALCTGFALWVLLLAGYGLQEKNTK